MIPLLLIELFPPFKDSFGPGTEPGSLNSIKGALGLRDITFLNL